MLVFDELAWHALVDEEGLVDHWRYPSLASLSSESTWYRNVYTVADTTNVAIPAMLTGRFPPDGALPLLADHPRNLFTLFGGSYRVWADEPITRLCPPSINECVRAPLPTGRRIATLASDLSTAWLHLVLPSPYRERLPSISTTWEGFGGGGTGAVSRAVPKDDGEFFHLAVDELSSEGRAERFREMLSAIDPDDDQVLYFSHLLLPHVPWEYPPVGCDVCDRAREGSGAGGHLWLDEPEPARVAEVRYLMQVEMVDLLVGEFVAELRRTGLYDRSLLVVVSDHGTSFRPSDLRRGFSETNAAEILPVPLWIKAPGQTWGDVIDATVTTLDILATMIDILGIDVPWELDGRPTRMSHSEPPSGLRVSTKADGEIVVPLAGLEERKYAAALAVSGAIGHPGDPYRASELKATFVPVEWEDDPDQLAFGNGRIYPVEGGALDGWVEVVRPVDGGLVIGGWAADLERMQPADAVVVYHNGRFLKLHGPTHERPDVPEGRCGFGIPFDGVDPDEARRAIAAGHVKFFAIYEDGRAARLEVTKDLMRGESPR